MVLVWVLISPNKVTGLKGNIYKWTWPGAGFVYDYDCVSAYNKENRGQIDGDFK